MATFTSTLPEKTWNELDRVSKKLDKPKNHIINEALNKYFFELEKQLYLDSFERVAKDDEMSELSQLGLLDYLNNLNQLDANM